MDGCLSLPEEPAVSLLAAGSETDDLPEELRQGFRGKSGASGSSF